MVDGIKGSSYWDQNKIDALNKPYGNIDQQPLATPIPSEEAAEYVQNSTNLIRDMIKNQNANADILRHEIQKIADSIQGAILLIKNNGGAASIDFDQKLDLAHIQSNIVRLLPLLKSLTKPESNLLGENDKLILLDIVNGENGSLHLMSDTLQSILDTLP
ncbi:MAG: hypothetical protein LBI37_00260 [Puniceicoccales bacterium]|jgi:hypothetical protein|nr:hypothetical protein [Puniceicoccales bacterium]